MSPDPQFEPGPGIGVRLKEARRRLGMDVKEAEDRTKIRARYLRALEAEDWELLPGAAYVRGFLRAYGQVLGLDGELLADEFRRRHEGAGNGYGTPDGPPPVRRPRPGGGGGPSWGLIALGALVALIVVLVLIGILGDSGDGSDRQRGAHRGDGAAAEKHRAARKREKRREEKRRLRPADLRLEALETVQVCLVGGRDDALIDSQLVTSGTSETFTGERRYRLDLEGGGEVKVVLAGREQTLDAPGDASYELDRHGVRPVTYAGAGCP